MPGADSSAPWSCEGSGLCHHLTGCLLLPPALSGLLPFSLLFPYSVLPTCSKYRSRQTALCVGLMRGSSFPPTLLHWTMTLFFLSNNTPVNLCKVSAKTSMRMLYQCLHSKQNQVVKTLTLPLYTTYTEN